MTALPEHTPLGKERRINRWHSIAVDGTPITYIVALAAVIAVLAIVPIPISIVLGSGKNFPISQSIYPLVGWMLGPVAGMVSNACGALVGAMIAPHTTTSVLATIVGAAAGGLAAGAMGATGPRKHWWLPLSAVFVVFYMGYAGRAVLVNHAVFKHVLLGSFIDWSAIMLFLSPMRTYFSQSISSSDMRRLGLGLFGGTWMIAGLVHLSTGMIVYAIINWPSEVWLAIAPIAPLEHGIRCLVGSVVGTGVIAGLRATGLVKPTQALY